MKDKRRYIIIAGVIILALLTIMLVGHLKRAESNTEDIDAQQEIVVEPVEVFCRLILKDVGEYDVVRATDGQSHVFKDGVDLGKSEYPIVSLKCKELNVDPIEIDIDQYKDENITGLYNINEHDAMAYIEYLKEIGYAEHARVYDDTLIEGLLEKPYTEAEITSENEEEIASEKQL
mgnify:CR=1 FL=1